MSSTIRIHKKYVVSHEYKPSYILQSFNQPAFCLSLISCSDHEADMEVRGQDEVFQEEVNVPVSWLPHHLSALF